MKFTTRHSPHRSRLWLLAGTLTLFVGVLLLATPAFAQLTNSGGLTELQGNVALGNKPLIQTIGSIINIFLGFLGVIAVGLILYAGFLWMTARGNEEQLGKAKRILSSAAIGLAIILASFALASYILDKLGGATNPSGPTTCWDGSQVTPPDTCPPYIFGGSGSKDFVVNGHHPTTDQTNVKLCSVVTAAFNRDVAAASVTPSTVTLYQGATQVSATALKPNANTVTFEHTGQDFAQNTAYTATLTTGLYDTSSPSIHLRSPGVTWSFTTGTETDNLAPTVELVPPPDPPAAPATKNVIPRDGATNVCRRTSIQMKFSEVMNPATMLLANVTLLDVTTNTAVQLKSMAIGSDLSSFTAYPADKLEPSHDFKVTVANMADACNNVMAPFTWTFRTNDVEDCKPELTKVYLTSDSAKTTTQGYYGDPVTLEGKNLGISINRALFNGFDTTSADITSWNDSVIKLKLPSGAPIPPNPQNVWVQMVNGPASNQLPFTLLSPYLRSLSPDKGAVGQFVTLKGASFGTAQGTVKFSTTDATFPCAASSWTDKQVIVQVPVGLPLGVAHVTLYRSDGKPSNTVDFTVNTDPLSPGLCQVIPSCTQSGKNPELDELDGKHFGTTQDKVFMSGQAASSIGSWGDEKIKNAKFSATFQDATHGVQVEVAGRRSNALDFDVPCTGGPQVVESQMCASATQSPSPYRDTTDACSNAAVSARFTAAMDAATITPANITVSKCGTGATFDATQCATAVTFSQFQVTPGSGNATGFMMSGPSSPFTAGTWYRGTISQAVKSEAGENLRADYQWHWQVSAAACAVASIKVQQDPTYIRKLDLDPPAGVAGPDPGSTGGFTATPTAANCNTLDPASYTWKPWSISGNTNSDGTEWVSKLSDSTNQAVAIAKGYMSGSTPATITASIDTPAKSGSAKVYVSATACSTSTDCVVAGCSVGVSSCVHNACTPAVTGLDPISGAPGTWTTISGCFFGPTRGSSTVVYNGDPAIAVDDVDGLWPSSAYCPDGTWTNDEIVSEVPPSAQSGKLTVHRGSPVAEAMSPSGFTVNAVVHPGVCKLSKNFVYETQLDSDKAEVTLQGRQFGDPQGAGTVTFYNKDANTPPNYTPISSASAYGSWSAIAIDKARAPAGAGMTSTKAIGVEQGGVQSNKLKFTVHAGSPPGGGLPPVVTSIDPDNGIAQAAVTSVVTVYGSNLTGGEVFFGTKPAPVAGCMQTDNAIVVEVPAGLTAGTCSSSKCDNDSTRTCTANSDCRAVSVRVKNDAGSSGALDFTPNDIIRPGICSISPTFGREGTKVSITGRNFTDNRKPPVSFVSLACDPADFAANPNLIQNGDFESGITGWTPQNGSWGTRLPPVPLVPATNKGASPTGGGSPVLSQDVAVVPGRYYHIHGDIYFTPNTDGTPSSAGYVQSSSFNLSCGASVTPCATPGWKTIDGIIRASTDTLTVTIGSWLVSDQGGLVVDNLSLKEEPVGCFASLTEGAAGDPLPQAINRFKINLPSFISNWSNRQITVEVPPKVHNGDLRVSVDYGAANGGLRGSNRVPFSGEPYITSLTPATGPTGTWMTIRGGNFGSCPTLGTVVSTPCTVSFASSAFGRIISEALPPACTNQVWTDSEIVVKAPVGGGTGVVRVTTVSGARTIPNEQKSDVFTYNEALPRPPGLCKLAPNSIAKPFPGVALTGDEFGDNPVTPEDKVNWPSGTAPTIFGWANQAIGVTPPVNTIPGPVTVQRQVDVITGRKCNGVQAGTTCLGVWQNTTTPRVLTSNPLQLSVASAGTAAVVPKLISEQPANTTPDACRNAAIVATFSDAVTPALVSANDFKVTTGGTPIEGTLRVGGTTAAFIPTKVLDPSLLYTVTISSSQVTSGSGVACSTTPTTCSWSFTTRAEVCTVDKVEFTVDGAAVPEAGYAFSKEQEHHLFAAVALTPAPNPQALNADVNWSKTDPMNTIGLSGSAGPSVTVTASGKNGQASLAATADISAYVGDGRKDKDPLTGKCPTGYPWYDRNGNNQKDSGECVKQGYVGTGSTSVDAFLCEVPWELKDPDFNFRLRYCRADTVKPGIEAPLPSGSFGGAGVPSLAGWKEYNAGTEISPISSADWSTTTSGYQDGTAVQSTTLWSKMLALSLTGLSTHTTYVARANIYIDPTAPGNSYGGMMLSTRPGCYPSPLPANTDMANSKIGWQQLQVAFDTGDSTSYNLCFWNANTSTMVPPGSDQFRFDNVTLAPVSNALQNLAQPGYTAGPGDPDIEREYFLKNPGNVDAIALRVYKNDERLSPRAWYDSRTDIIKGSPQSTTVDGYAAVKDGTAVYVAALNETADSGPPVRMNVYGNIYVLTYNRGATGDTAKVAGQLVSGWAFNTNYGAAHKVQLQDDFQRLIDRETLRDSLETYASGHGQTIPALAGGSYVKGLSVSPWASWQQALGSALKSTAPTDPLNTFNGCPAGYDATTCWDAIHKAFSCPAGSHVYQYQAESTTKAKLLMNMELKGVTWCSTQKMSGNDPTCLSSPSDVTVVDGGDLGACDSLSLEAEFGHPPLTVVPAAGGSVASTDGRISCGGTCSVAYAGGAPVTLTATADAGHVFTGWTGDCSGTDANCALSMLSNRTVKANFAPIATLTVAVPSNGTVTGPGINCAGDCTETYAQGTTVTLTAASAAGYVLTAWGGACSPAAGSPTCNVNVASATSVSVAFSPGATITVNTLGAGGGTVVSAPVGITCGSDCSGTFAVGTTVTLTANPSAGSAFSIWGGACSGANPVCTLTAAGAPAVSATFVPAVALTVVSAGNGSGTVTSIPAGINCGSTCSASYASGTSVTLTAVSAADSSFAGWSGGGCTGTGSCVLNNLTVATTVTATFNSVNFNLNVNKVGTGTVTLSPSGTSCGASCTTYAGGTTVTLTATAGSGFLFSSWGGACTGISPSCTVTMDATKSVTATFTASASAISLTVNKLGTGSGTITSNPAGISCGATCSASYTSGTGVVLTAVQAAGSVFTGWSGAGCSGTGTCSVTLSSNASVSATFVLSHSLTVTPSGAGSGTVTSNPAGITCGATCNASYASTTSVTLTAVPSASSVFTGWSGAGCSGTGTCTVAMSADAVVSPNFAVGFTLTITRPGTGSGTITSNPAGITCGATCNASYASTTSVTLTAVPAAGSVFFTGWSGSGCSGTGTCTVVLSAARAVTATFAKAYTLSVTKSGTGTGTVKVAADLSINCGSGVACSSTYAENSTVTLTAVPDLGSTVTSWSQVGCTGTSCTVTMSASKTINVVFDIITHTVTVTPSGAGSGTVTSNPAGITCSAPCSAAFPDGLPVALTATPAAGSIFVGWSGDCTGLSCTLTVDANKSVTATFALARTITLTIAGAGSGSVSSSPAGISCTSGPSCPPASYVNGTTVVLTATAQAGSIFSSWSGDCASFGNSPTCTLALTASRTTTATFTIAPSYSLSVATSGSGQVASFPGGITCGATCTASFSSGTSVTLTAAAAAGYTFAGWSGLAGCSGTGTCTTSMTTNRSVTATFTPLAASHTVAVSMTGLGAITSSPSGILCGSSCSASFADGSNITITASALSGYVFSSWSGDCSGTSPTCTFASLAADRSAVANFVVGSSYTIHVTKTGAGTGTVVSNPAGIDCGVACVASFSSVTPVALTATPGAGYSFISWSGDCTGSSTCSLSPGADRNVTADFEPVYTITVTKAGAGSGTVTSSPAGVSCGGTCVGSFAAASSVTLTATPAAGSSFTSWSGDCTGATCTVTMDAAKSVTATFAQAPVTLSLVVSGSGTVTLSPVPITGSSSCSGGTCSVTYMNGTTVTLAASANAGNVFANWSGAAGCSTNATCTFTISGSAIVTATFVAIGPPTVNTTAASSSASSSSSTIMSERNIVPSVVLASVSGADATMIDGGATMRLAISTGPIGPPPPPTYTAYLNGNVNPNGLATTAWFRWGTSNLSCASLPSATAIKNPGSGGAPINISQVLSGLSNTTYYFCAVGNNSMGTTYGGVRSFNPVSDVIIAPSN